ncbi:hypothetical protein [Lysobacter gummosus]|uniref:hypothetical protein n=1 Tax=Lysobacter gummosus TaxID=262324 RepID=UPI0036330750
MQPCTRPCCGRDRIHAPSGQASIIAKWQNRPITNTVTACWWKPASPKSPVRRFIRYWCLTTITPRWTSSSRC